MGICWWADGSVCERVGRQACKMVHGYKGFQMTDQICNAVFRREEGWLNEVGERQLDKIAAGMLDGWACWETCG